MSQRSAPMSWLGLIVRNILRRPGRASFTLAGVALAVASYMALTGLARGLVESAAASHDERGVDLVASHKGLVDMFAGSLPESLAGAIRSRPGVADVAAELDASLELGDAPVIVTGWRADQFTFREIRLRDGRLPRAGAGEVLVGEGLAEAAGLGVGDEIELSFTPLRVAGITAFESGFLRNMVVMRLEDLQALLSRPGQVTLFQVRLDQPGDAAAREAARASIAALRPDLSVATTAEAMRASRLIQTVDSTALAIALVALAIGCLSVLNTMAMGVEERTRDIGILSSIGWPRGRILALILSEGALLAGIGGLIGIALGWVGHRLLAESLTPGAALPHSVMAVHAVRAEMAALAVGLAGALAPAWRASRMPPAAALRRQ